MRLCYKWINACRVMCMHLMHFFSDYIITTSHTFQWSCHSQTFEWVLHHFSSSQYGLYYPLTLTLWYMQMLWKCVLLLLYFLTCIKFFSEMLMIMYPYMDNGDLTQVYQNLDRKNRSRVLSQISEGLAFLHRPVQGVR